MKKNFFKKLSFVLALAMIVSVIGPATGAFAATKTPKINVATKVLTVGQVNEYDFSVANKISGSKYAWSSSDKAVATVDKSGLTTAIAPGKATITVKVTAKVKGKSKSYTSKAVVTVKDNFKSLTVAPADDKFAVDKETTFTATGTTYSGASTSSTAKIYWTVTGKDGAATTDATITDAGVFKATKPGEYKVTAKAYQSAQAHDLSKDATATADYAVTVKAALKSVTQVDADTITATFDSDMSKTDLSATTAKLYTIIGDKQVATGAEKIKTLTLDSTGKVATIDLYASLSAESKYDFVYGEMKASFTAAKKSMDQVKKIVFNNFDVNFGVPTNMLDKVVGLNADGVAIYTGTELVASGATLTFTYGGEAAKGYAYGTNVCLYTAGTTANVTAKYSYTYYDTTAKAMATNSSEATAVATAITPNAMDNSSLQFEVVTGNQVATDATWSGNLKLAVLDPGYSIQARYKTNTNSTSYTYSWVGANVAGFTYVSSNPAILTINGSNVIAASAGTATVVVKNSAGVAITSFDVTVEAKRSFGTASADTPEITVGNTTLSTKPVVAFSTVDTLGKGFTAAVDSTSWITKPATNAVVPTFNTTTVAAADGSYNKTALQFNANGATPGFYILKVVLKHTDITGNGTTKEVTVNITVLDGASTTVSYWKAEADSTKVDLNNNYGQTINFGVYGYNSNGVRVAQLTPADYDLTVMAGASDVTSWWVGGNVAGESIKAVTVNNGVVTANVWWSDWTVTATAKATNATLHITKGDYLGSFVINVTNSAKTSFTVDKYTAVTGTSILAAASDAFTFVTNDTNSINANELVNINKIVYYVGNTKMTAVANPSADPTKNEVSLSTALTTGQNVLITEVDYYTVDTNNNKLNYTFNPNVTLTVNAQ